MTMSPTVDSRAILRGGAGTHVNPFGKPTHMVHTGIIAVSLRDWSARLSQRRRAGATATRLSVYDLSRRNGRPRQR